MTRRHAAPPGSFELDLDSFPFPDVPLLDYELFQRLLEARVDRGEVFNDKSRDA